MMTDLSTLDRTITGSVWAESQAMAHLIALCDRFGGRFAGSANELAAGDYLLDQLGKFGLAHVRAEPFHYQGWRRGASSVELLEPVAVALDAIALPGSPAGDVSAELASVGDGEEEDYTRVGEALRGKVALCNAESGAGYGRPASHRRSKYLRAVAAGAVAFLYINQNPGMLAVTGGLASASAAPIPGFGLSYETGAFLSRALDVGNVRLRLRGEHVLPDVLSRNILADLPGRDSAASTIVVGAHYDGHDIAQGATDNASGSVALLEVARVLAPHRGVLRRNLRFVFFGSEESGLLGAWWHSRTHAAEASSTACMLNMDSVVAGPPGGQKLHCGNSPQLAATILDIVKRTGLPVSVDEVLSSASDHFPFVTQGIPVATMGASVSQTGLVGRGWGHTTADTVDKVEPAALRLAAATSARLLLHMTQADSLGRPMPRKRIPAFLQATGTQAAAERGATLALHG